MELEEVLLAIHSNGFRGEGLFPLCIVQIFSFHFEESLVIDQKIVLESYVLRSNMGDTSASCSV